jgi:hypothetical protein
VLKDDNASKAQLTLAKKNVATHQPALKKEASSKVSNTKVSNTNALNHDTTVKELNLRFSTVLIDNLEVEKNDDQSLTDFRIDQR